MADSWLNAQGLPSGIDSLENALFPVADGDSLTGVLDNVARSRDQRLARFILPGEGDGTEFEFLFYPVSFDKRDCIGVQAIREIRHDADENRVNLNLLVEERTAEILELNAFLSSIVDSSTETFIIAVGTNGTILSFNEGACLLFGYSKNEVIARLQASQLFASADPDEGAWHEMEQDARENGKSRRLATLLRKDGGSFPALIDLTPLRNTEQQTMGMLFLGRDVSETVRTQRELEERKEELEFINRLSLDISQTLQLEDIASISIENLVRQFNGLGGGLYVKNRSTGVLRLIAAVPEKGKDPGESMLAISEEDATLLEEGEVLLREFPAGASGLRDEQPASSGTRLMLPLLPKASFLGVVIILSRNRLDRTIELLNFLSAIGATIGGAIENAILYFESLNKSIEIKKQNQELDEFAYVVSHDLKEPLAGISFISNLLVDEYYDVFDETGKTYITSLIDFSKRLGSLTEALLDLSRIGRLTQPPERVPVSLVLHSVQQNLSFRLARRDRSIQIKVPKIFPEVYGDKTRIEQVFYNLMSNALKFNDKPDILVEVGFTDYDADFFEFFVKDNGIGIEPEYFEKIFKIFERLNSREEYEGNGAGLTIVKKIIEHHGGKIWLDSVLSQSTTFYFTLPKCKNE
jgi:PAS domain S-box-containing protein